MESSTEKTTKPVAEHSIEKRELNLSKKQQQDEKTRETKFLAEVWHWNILKKLISY